MLQLPEIEGLDQLTLQVEFLAVGVGAALCWRAARYLLRQWHSWRWQRRIAAEQAIFLDEQREFNLTMGNLDDNPDTPGPGELIGQALAQIAGFAATFALAVYLGVDWEIVLLASAAVWWLAAWAWKQIHQPPSREMPDLESAPTRETIVPREAVLGFAAAVCTIGLFALLVFSI